MWAVWWLLAPLSGQAVVVDRIAITVGNQVITDSEIRLQVRIVALLNGKAPDLSAKERRAAAERLIDQFLLTREQDVTRFSEPAMVDVVQEIAAFQKEHFQSEAEFRKEMAARAIQEEDLRRYLQSQLRTLRFIEFRFRAGVQVTETEIQAYYQGPFTADWKKSHQNNPAPLDEVIDEIEEILIAKQVDTNTEEWLAQARKTTPIRYREEAFQ